MKVKIGDKQFIIGWQYTFEDVVLGGGKLSYVPRTTCTISEIQADNTLYQVAQATVGAHSSDLFSKNSGRKLSLERAMTQMVPGRLPANPLTWVPLFHKEDRTHIWQEYFKMRNGKW
jgi:hypothetical protein